MDERARATHRDLLRGGMDALSNDEIQDLLNQGTESLKQRNFHTVNNEASYLQKYLRLCEEFLEGEDDLREAKIKLQKLNQSFNHLRYDDALTNCPDFVNLFFEGLKSNVVIPYGVMYA